MMFDRMKVLVFVMGFLVASSASFAIGKVVYDGVTVSRITSVYDGDTFRCDVDGWPAVIGKNIGVRVYGIDTPELRGTTGKVKEMARNAKRLALHMLEGAKVVELRNIRRGKYFRIVAEVYVDGKSLAEVLIKNGLAKEYYGGKKSVWE